jgi:hypothetical protein
VDILNVGDNMAIVDFFIMGVDARPDWFQNLVTANKIHTFTDEPSGSPFKFQKTYAVISTRMGIARAAYNSYVALHSNGDVMPCFATEIVSFLRKKLCDANKECEEHTEEHF